MHVFSDFSKLKELVGAVSKAQTSTSPNFGALSAVVNKILILHKIGEEKIQTAETRGSIDPRESFGIELFPPIIPDRIGNFKSANIYASV